MWEKMSQTLPHGEIGIGFPPRRFQSNSLVRKNELELARSCISQPLPQGQLHKRADYLKDNDNIEDKKAN